MKIQTNATNILERTSSFLRVGLLARTPVWYDVIVKSPPSTKFARQPKLVNPSTGAYTAKLREFSDNRNSSSGTYKTRANKHEKRVSTSAVYRAPKLYYFEDKLRSLFYKQHPWELSRPKILVENQGDEKHDWSRIQQLGKPLDGESVVQRTLYLLGSGEHTNLIDAYDQARFEFYRLRMQQELEEQVAQEEAGMLGSVFGPSAVEFGLRKEQEVIDDWKKKALKQVELMSAKRSDQSANWGTREDNANDAVEIEELEL
ncbi:mitochondrial 37S ribosomal protein mS23 Ecym_3329 [Eremothecium cymbalariae DBVPG|uniref:37S ribosomal protein S25, mitochondrial n=1 Tax=Eremothecium cymbalariae (strain CBS 270.75 / DBVPG 7215 / KCTC 17166 / NRRL Y-17582) TaxID=931890 RepID=G8JRQ0_ERECY|nr:Hypothetical protein Ecym_3329 [Eremothecium cymbalariae DBVPG\